MWLREWEFREGSIGVIWRWKRILGWIDRGRILWRTEDWEYVGGNVCGLSKCTDRNEILWERHVQSKPATYVVNHTSPIPMRQKLCFESGHRKL